MKKYSLGMDIGGTKCAVILGGTPPDAASSRPFLLDRISFSTNPAGGAQATVSALLDAAEELLRRRGADAQEVVGVGISCGGPLDSARGLILNPPNLYGWDRVPIVELVHKRLGIPAYLQNDANAGALAEWCFGAARGLENVVFLTFGTGMGAGLILNGRLYSGTNGMAGEIGHIRMADNGPVGYGKIGSFEGFCSGGGILQLSKALVLEKLQRGEHPAFCPDFTSIERLDAKSVAEAAEQGDPVACEIYQKCGIYLGRGLAVILDILNPEIVVIGSIFERSSRLLWPYAEPEMKREALARNADVCRVVPSALGSRIGDYAAISVAFSSLYSGRRGATQP